MQVWEGGRGGRGPAWVGDGTPVWCSCFGLGLGLPIEAWRLVARVPRSAFPAYLRASLEPFSYQSHHAFRRIAFFERVPVPGYCGECGAGFVDSTGPDEGGDDEGEEVGGGDEEGVIELLAV